MDNNASTMVSNGIIEGGKEFIFDKRAMNQDSKLVNEIDKMLDELEPPPSFERCIYRVPKELRKVNEKAYTPRIVSIGPFHHNNKNFESMEQVKKRYMKKFVRRSGNFSLKKCIDFVKKREAKIRDCYSEPIKMETNELVKMILVDSCFIIQFLISYHNNWEDNDDRSLSLEPMMCGNIALDLILLENQVPFFVLEGIFSLANFASSGACSILDLSLHFFDHNCNLPYIIEEFNKHNNEHDFQSVKHFTHLVLLLYRPPPQELSPMRKEKFQSLRNSTNLTKVGVTFRKKSSSKGLFDITFTNEVLEIPSIPLTDDTEIQIRNLMALELCRYPEKSFITDYVVFINCLIDNRKDVDLLVRKKIIVNYLGDNKVAADLFNSLCINIRYDMGNFYFYQVCKQLNDYCEVRRHKFKAILKHDYFDTPWKTASTIAAITLLVLTLIQTVCSIMSVINGK
ncbi:hypothetical protein LguiA_033073 [Lonicera macranthoides]